MKRHLLFSLFLALALVFSGCTLPTLPPGIFTTTGGGGEDTPSAPPYDEDTTSYGFYYDQLGANEKAVYRAIYKGARAGIDLPFSLFEPLLIKSDEEGGTQAVTNAVRGIIQPAMDALAYDHPEIAWIAYGGEDGSSFSISTRTKQDESGDKITEVASLTFILALKAPIASVEDIASFEGEMNAVLDAMLAESAAAESRYERLALLQQALCARVVYDKTGARVHEAAGALIDGAAVCDGYAKAFKILCDRAGIPCVVVAGTAMQSDTAEPHAWNYVQMENGLWYAVDTTWNDDGDSAAGDYFLLGAMSAPLPGRAPFALSHLPDGKFSAGEYEPFLFPVLSDTRYLPFVG